ncbi:hypothetical protein PF008_g8029 [Phytophthora fragariae]|uniref:HTH psq-type domain-containing protein n=1 Tax=Phytophthora fragariae TaxID=53985 RepID=A0A6G0S1S1_9STRA|nr:hypothetical protein PF008_g8029 [Phytophthora fragariae]
MTGLEEELFELIWRRARQLRGGHNHSTANSTLSSRFSGKACMPATPRSSKQRSYTIQQKRDALVLASDIGTKPAADFLGYSPRTVQDWAAQRDAIFDFKGAQVSKTLKGQGREEIIPFAHGLLTFMKDMRRDEEVRLLLFR